MSQKYTKKNQINWVEKKEKKKKRNRAASYKTQQKYEDSEKIITKYKYTITHKSDTTRRSLTNKDYK